MKLNTSYKQLFFISLPIMLGSAAQNVIALTDSVFLYHLSETDFAAIGFVGVFYLTIAAIGYGFSKGGQIIIARRYGQIKYDDIGSTFYAMLVFELALAVIMFLVMQFGSPFIFGAILHSDAVYQLCLEYIAPRSWGVFFSYLGVSAIALYTGVARTWFIIVDTIILTVVNIALNYALIFGEFGLPSMGIAGAGWASAISEAVAFMAFLVFILFDKGTSRLRLNRMPKIKWSLIKSMVRVSSPIVVQSAIGIGSWFIFFGLIENLGERPLAITNLVRIVYLILSIPCWGFSAGINTLVSNTIGAGFPQEVWPVVLKAIKITLITTLSLALPITLFPSFFLYPLLGSEDMSLIIDAQPVLYVLLGILVLFSIGVVMLNGLTGTGRTYAALKLQIWCTLAYFGIVFYIVEYTSLGLPWVWSSEILYWFLLIAFCGYYFRRGRWRNISV
jgi:putative MATE family efflux protein